MLIIDIINSIKIIKCNKAYSSNKVKIYKNLYNSSRLKSGRKLFFTLKTLSLIISKFCLIIFAFSWNIYSLPSVITLNLYVIESILVLTLSASSELKAMLSSSPRLSTFLLRSLKSALIAFTFSKGYFQSFLMKLDLFYLEKPLEYMHVLIIDLRNDAV
uniref:Uncharacterized protein n=1 Tax=Trametes cingulata TaxID=575983 RepID=D3YNM9_9APHY|nr:hypothetical protein TrcifM_p17 [Trametes cingulata]ADD21059.1 hypothetical protein [Trametes cingulata]